MIRDIVKKLVDGTPISVLVLPVHESSQVRQAMLSVDKGGAIWLEVGFDGPVPGSSSSGISTGLLGGAGRKDLICEATNGSELGLMGVRRHRYRSSGANDHWWETLSVDNVLFGDGDVAEFRGSNARVGESAVDGLEPWLPGAFWESEHRWNEDGTASGVNISLDETVTGSFEHDGFEVTVGRSWEADYTYSSRRSSRTGHRFGFVRTEAVDPRSFSDHFVIHSRVAELVSVVAQTRCSWHSHKISGGATRGEEADHASQREFPVHLVSRDTLAGQLAPEPDIEHRPLARFEAIGIEGLDQWLRSYAKWARVISPVVRDVQVGIRSRDERVVSLGIALDTAGAILNPVGGDFDGLNLGGTAQNIYRAVHHGVLGDWFDEPDLLRVVRGVARTYNKVKHFKEGEVPTPLQKYVCEEFLAVGSRHFVLSLASRDLDFDPMHAVARQVEWIRGLGTPGWFDDDGKWLGD